MNTNQPNGSNFPNRTPAPARSPSPNPTSPTSMYESTGDAVPPSTGSASAIIFGCMGLAALVIAVGIWKMMSSSGSPQPAQAMVNPWVEQQKIMREALDMAKEAQQMQRQHLQQMQEEMMEAEGYYDQESYD